jgi:hypothetical protein
MVTFGGCAFRRSSKIFCDRPNTTPGVGRFRRPNAGLDAENRYGIFELITYTLHAAIRASLPTIRRFPEDS